jgi:hypothetical protein
LKRRAISISLSHKNKPRIYVGTKHTDKTKKVMSEKISDKLAEKFKVPVMYAAFLKKKIKPMVEYINGDTPKWNAVCKHLKSQYSEPQYRFIIDAFDSLGMKIYS